VKLISTGLDAKSISMIQDFWLKQQKSGNADVERVNAVEE
jgi:hypothetical protein